MTCQWSARSAAVALAIQPVSRANPGVMEPGGSVGVVGPGVASGLPPPPPPQAARSNEPARSEAHTLFRAENRTGKSPIVSVTFRHEIGAGPCDNHAENAKESCPFAPGGGGQTVAGSVLLYSAGDPTAGLCWLSRKEGSNLVVNKSSATPRLRVQQAAFAAVAVSRSAFHFRCSAERSSDGHRLDQARRGGR